MQLTRLMMTAKTLAVVLVLITPTIAKASESEDSASEDHIRTIACTTPFRITEKAEQKPGGSLYGGPIPNESMPMNMSTNTDMDMESDGGGMNAKKMDEMDGAHTLHKGFRGGELFMIKNQLHHMEALFTRECGYQVFFYNAFTEPIRADRFQAFMFVLPEDEDDFEEVPYFLNLSEDGSHLVNLMYGSHHREEHEEAFETELYVKFPESDIARRYSVMVGTEMAWE